ncbi:hypothetical protein FRC01_004878, partial [Tulasnella sp. 417]
MTQNQTLQKYTVVTPALQHYRIDGSDLVGSIQRLTPWTLVFEHRKKAKRPVQPKYVRNLMSFDSSTVLYVISHPSGQFSILFMTSESDMNTILNHPDHFAPKYSVRRIQRPEEPVPERTFSPNTKISELADVQCYLKAYFQRIYDARVEEKARKKREKQEKSTAPGPSTLEDADSAKPKTRRTRRA